MGAPTAAPSHKPPSRGKSTGALQDAEEAPLTLDGLLGVAARQPDEVLRKARMAHRKRMQFVERTNRAFDKELHEDTRRTETRIQYETEEMRYADWEASPRGPHPEPRRQLSRSPSFSASGSPHAHAHGPLGGSHHGFRASRGSTGDGSSTAPGQVDAWALPGGVYEAWAEAARTPRPGAALFGSSGLLSPSGPLRARSARPSPASTPGGVASAAFAANGARSLGSAQPSPRAPSSEVGDPQWAHGAPGSPAASSRGPLSSRSPSRRFSMTGPVPVLSPWTSQAPPQSPPPQLRLPSPSRRGSGLGVAGVGYGSAAAGQPPAAAPFPFQGPQVPGLMSPTPSARALALQAQSQPWALQARLSSSGPAPMSARSQRPMSSARGSGGSWQQRFRTGRDPQPNSDSDEDELPPPPPLRSPSRTLLPAAAGAEGPPAAELAEAAAAAAAVGEISLAAPPGAAADGPDGDGSGSGGEDSNAGGGEALPAADSPAGSSHETLDFAPLSPGPFSAPTPPAGVPPLLPSPIPVTRQGPAHMSVLVSAAAKAIARGAGSAAAGLGGLRRSLESASGLGGAFSARHRSNQMPLGVVGIGLGIGGSAVQASASVSLSGGSGGGGGPRSGPLLRPPQRRGSGLSASFTAGSPSPQSLLSQLASGRNSPLSMTATPAHLAQRLSFKRRVESAPSRKSLRVESSAPTPPQPEPEPQPHGEQQPAAAPEPVPDVGVLVGGPLEVPLVSEALEAGPSSAPSRLDVGEEPQLEPQPVPVAAADVGAAEALQPSPQPDPASEGKPGPLPMEEPEGVPELGLEPGSAQARERGQEEVLPAAPSPEPLLLPESEPESAGAEAEAEAGLAVAASPAHAAAGAGESSGDQAGEPGALEGEGEEEEEELRVVEATEAEAREEAFAGGPAILPSPPLHPPEARGEQAHAANPHHVHILRHHPHPPVHSHHAHHPHHPQPHPPSAPPPDAPASPSLPSPVARPGRFARHPSTRAPASPAHPDSQADAPASPPPPRPPKLPLDSLATPSANSPRPRISVRAQPEWKEHGLADDQDHGTQREPRDGTEGFGVVSRRTPRKPAVAEAPVRHTVEF
ncbi:hypothetical protein HYH03_003316 [Edaphochlamys debaryana]|uniref:Uncharacterized protein n=1 Tax=Edaphochlamys debaryana TaxID=47281 RepID=A0A836C3A2_9CHLO|nr:hypothetical protein HYH03_003316 [Edaphochlamys debaryana]|eukprot:KAG2498565.1 hypothetical protein HYH03_003316 [Edaphochlamys debaryana]